MPISDDGVDSVPGDSSREPESATPSSDNKVTAHLFLMKPKQATDSTSSFPKMKPVTSMDVHPDEAFPQPPNRQPSRMTPEEIERFKAERSRLMQQEQELMERNSRTTPSSAAEPDRNDSEIPNHEAPSLRVGANPDDVTRIRDKVGPKELGLLDYIEDIEVVESLMEAAAWIQHALLEVFTEADIEIEATVDDDDAEPLRMRFIPGVSAHHRRALFSLATKIQQDAVKGTDWISWNPDAVPPDEDEEEVEAAAVRWPPRPSQSVSRPPGTPEPSSHGCLPHDPTWR